MVKAVSWLITVLWMALIFTASSMKFEQGPPIFPGDDKVAHFIEYGILASLFYNALIKTFINIKGKFVTVILAVLFSVIYGITDEIHQLFVPTREFSFFDLTADFIGSAFFCAVFHFYHNKSSISKL